MTLDDVLYAGLNRRVAAIDKDTGDILWQWKAPSGSGFVSLLLDGNHLFAAVQGYIFCLDAATGQQLWHNPMRGFGYGVTSLASSRGSSDSGLLGEAAAQAASAAAATVVATG